MTRMTGHLLTALRDRQVEIAEVAQTLAPYLRLRPTPGALLDVEDLAFRLRRRARAWDALMARVEANVDADIYTAADAVYEARTRARQADGKFVEAA